MRKLLLILLALLAFPALTQSRGFKSFYGEGKKFMAAGNYQDALRSFKEAFRIEPKAQRYKEEGSFFAFYLPRYRIALCYEQLDLSEAVVWIDKSKEALESDLLRKKKKDLASYHADLDRITRAAKKARSEKNRLYELALAEARQLLSLERFDQAKQAFEKVYQMDPSRSEAQTGLANIENARETLLQRLELAVERALLKKDWPAAEAELAKMTRVGADSNRIDPLKSLLDEAKEKVRLAMLAEEKIKAAKRIAKNTPPPKQSPVVSSRPLPTATSKKSSALQLAKRNKTEMKGLLLASLQPYRRGYPEDALKKLRQIPVAKAETFGSYHWLKGVFLLSVYQQSANPDESLKLEASSAMAQVARLMPYFVPDPKLYPAFVTFFYEQISAQLTQTK